MDQNQIAEIKDSSNDNEIVEAPFEGGDAGSNDQTNEDCAFDAAIASDEHELDIA